MVVGNEGFIKFKFVVRFLKTNSGKKGEGMPVVRNPQFYFREGFCWNNVLTTFIRCKIKQKTVQSTESMSFFSVFESVPEYYIITVMNSSFAAYYIDSFVNSTSHCTTGDAKLIPILIPNSEQLNFCKSLFDKIIELKKIEVSLSTLEEKVISNIDVIEKELDKFVCELYGI